MSFDHTRVAQRFANGVGVKLDPSIVPKLALDHWKTYGVVNSEMSRFFVERLIELGALRRDGHTLRNKQGLIVSHASICEFALEVLDTNFPRV